MPASHRRRDLGRLTKWAVLSSLVGISGGVAAWLFRGLTRFLSTWLFEAPTGIDTEGVGGVGARAWLVLLVPALGGLAVGYLVQRFAPEAEGHGTDSVIRAFHRMKGVVRRRVILLKALTSAITIGSGGSAGQEGPVAQIGAGIGSSLAQTLHLSDRDRRLFLLSGATAGVGAMFGSPLGAALFMPEVLYRRSEFEGEAILPCITASIFAYATYTALAGHHRAVELDPQLLEQLTFEPAHIAVYLVLGVLCAVAGWLYTNLFYGVHKGFDRLKVVPKMLRPAIGGLLLGALALSLAPAGGAHGVLFGGYELIHEAIAGSSLAPKVLLLMALAKMLATSLSVSSGGSGGVFAPALAIGALLGASVGRGAEEFFPNLQLHAGAVALVGMGGFFAGVAKVPIASVVMVSEMTGGYALLAPLMLVAVVHLVLSTRWTMYRAQVNSQIDSPAHVGDFVVDVLQSVRVSDVLEEVRPPRLIHEDVTLRGAMKIVAGSHETHFPVVDDEERLVGIFSLSDLRRIFLENIVEDLVIVRDFMREQVVTVRLEDSLHDAQRLMTRRNVNALPVVSSQDPRKVVALLEHNAIGRLYNEQLARLKSEE